MLDFFYYVDRARYIVISFREMRNCEFNILIFHVLMAKSNVYGINLANSVTLIFESNMIFTSPNVYVPFHRSISY